MNTAETNTARGRWSRLSKKGKGVAIGLGAFLGLAGLTFAALVLVTRGGSVTFDRVSADVVFVSGSSVTTCSDTGLDPIAEGGDSGADLATCSAEATRTDISVDITSSFPNYAPEIVTEAYTPEGSETPLYLVGLKVLKSNGDAFAEGTAPLRAELAAGQCGAEIGAGQGSVSSGSEGIQYSEGWPVTFRLVDTGQGTPANVSLSFEFGPEAVDCVDGYTP